jgi:hypothetical protein
MCQSENQAKVSEFLKHTYSENPEYLISKGLD